MEELEWVIKRADGTEQLLKADDPLIAAAKSVSGNVSGPTSVPLPDVYRARQGLVRDEWKQTEKDSWNPNIGTGVFAGAVRAAANIDLGATDAFVSLVDSGRQVADKLGMESISGGIKAFTDKAFEGTAKLRPDMPETAGMVNKFITGNVAEGMGQGVAFLAGGTLAAAVKIPAKIAAALFGAGASGSAAARDAEDAGADDDQVWETFWMNSIVGTSEALPLGPILGKLLGKTVSKKLLKDVIVEASEEAVQEAGQTILEAAIAKKVYDPDRDVWNWDAIGEASATGGTVGAIMSLFSGLINRRGRSRSGPTPPPGVADPATPNRMRDGSQTQAINPESETEATKPNKTLTAAAEKTQRLRAALAASKTRAAIPTAPLSVEEVAAVRGELLEMNVTEAELDAIDSTLPDRIEGESDAAFASRVGRGVVQTLVELRAAGELDVLADKLDALNPTADEQRILELNFVRQEEGETREAYLPRRIKATIDSLTAMRAPKVAPTITNPQQAAFESIDTTQPVETGAEWAARLAGDPPEVKSPTPTISTNTSVVETPDSQPSTPPTPTPTTNEQLEETADQPVIAETNLAADPTRGKLPQNGGVDGERTQVKRVSYPKTSVDPVEVAAQSKPSGLPDTDDQLGTGEVKKQDSKGVVKTGVPNTPRDTVPGGQDDAGVGSGNRGDAASDQGDGVADEASRRADYETLIAGVIAKTKDPSKRAKLIADVDAGLAYLENFRSELEEAAADVGIPLVVEYHHSPDAKDIGMGADFDGNTLLVNPAVFGPQMKAFDKNADESNPKKGSTRGKHKRVTGFTNGIEALFQEEMLHLASFRVLKQMHADSDSTAGFNKWMVEFSNDILEDSTKNFKDLIQGMYGTSPNLGLELVRTYLQFIRHTGGEQVFTEDFTGTLEQYNAGVQLKKAFQSVDRLDTLLGKVAVGSGTARLTEIATRTQEWIDKNTNAPKVKSGPKPFDQPGKDGISGEERFRMNMLSSFETEARAHTTEGTEDSKYHEYYSALIAYVERQGDPVNGVTLWNHAPYVTVAVEGVATPVEMPAAIKASYDQYNDINGGLTGLDSIRKNNGNDAADRVAMKTRRNLAENLAEPDRTFSEIFKNVAVSGARGLALQEVYKEIKNGVQFTSFQASQDADAAIENQVRDTDAIREAEPENRNVGRGSIEGEVDTGEPKEPSGDAPIVPTSSADTEKVSASANLFKNLSGTFAADEELPASQVELFEDWVATKPWGTVDQILKNADAHAVELGRTADEEGAGNDFDFVFQRYLKYVGRIRQAGGAAVSRNNDAEYAAAVTAEDVKTQQRLVDAAAKAAGYNVGPLLHGTEKKFDAFKEGPTKKQEQFSFGHHFTSSPGLASKYGTRLISAYLSTENTLDAEQVVYRDSALGEWLLSIAPKTSWFPESGRHAVYLRNALDALPAAKVKEALISAGYDSLNYNAEFSEREIRGYRKLEEGPSTIVWSPEQIKSADPITYDSDGNVIPLSERFNAKEPRMAYGAPIQTESDNFKKWFGDSKVVDETGEPLRVYHGTTKTFSEFNPGAGNPLDAGWFGKGFYFAKNAKKSTEFSGLRSGGSQQTMPVYLNLRNPYTAEVSNVRSLRDSDKFLSDIKAKFKPGQNVGQQGWLYEFTPKSMVASDILKANGYDGIIVEDKANGDHEYIAFHPEQIKSATGNNGNFDPKVRNIAGGAPIQVDVEAEQIRIATMGKAEIAALEKEAARGGNDAFQSKLYLKGKRMLEHLLKFASGKLVLSEELPSGITDPAILEYASDIGLDRAEMDEWQGVIRIESGAQAIVDATGDVVDAEDIRDAQVAEGESAERIAYANTQLEAARADLDSYLESIPDESAARAEEILEFKADQIEIRSSANTLNDRAVKRVFTEPLSTMDPIESAFQFTLADVKTLQETLAYRATETDDIEAVEHARAVAEAKLGHIQNRLAVFRGNHARKKDDAVEQTEHVAKLLEELDAELQVNNSEKGKILQPLEAELIASRAKEGGAGAILPEEEQRAVFQHVGAMHKMADEFANSDLEPIAAAYHVMLHPTPNFEVEAALTGVLEPLNTNIGAVAQQLGVTKEVFVGMASDMWNDNNLSRMMSRLTKFLKNKPDADRLRALSLIHSTPKIKDKKAIASKLATAERKALRTFSKEHKALVKKAVAAQIKLRTSEKVAALFDKVAESQGFKELAFFADNPGDLHEHTERMIFPSSDQVLFAAFGDTMALSINPSAGRKTRDQWYDQLEKWQQAAGKYVNDWQKAKADYVLDPDNAKLPEALGFDSRTARGLRLVLDEQIGTYLDAFSIESPTKFAKVPAMFSRLNSGALPFGEAVFSKIFGQLDQVLKLVPVPWAKTLRKEFQDLSRANRSGTSVNRKYADFSSVRQQALEAHGFKLEEDYDKAVFQHMAILGRKLDSPIDLEYVLPSGEIVKKQDLALLKMQQDAFKDIQEGMARDSGVESVVGDRTFFRKARAVGKFSVMRRKNSDTVAALKKSIEDVYFSTAAEESERLALIKSKDLDTSKLSPFATFWDAHTDVLQSMILDSQLPASDRNFKRATNIEAAMNHLFSTNEQVDSLEDFRELVATHASEKYLSSEGVETSPTPESIQEQIDLELKTYMDKILGPAKSMATAGTAADISMRSTANQFTQTANKLDLPSSTYSYGAVSSLDWAAFMSGPRAVAEVKVLEGIERFVTDLNEHRAMFEAGEVARPKAVRSDGQYVRMLDAMATQLSLQQQGLTQSTKERRTTDRTSGNHGPLGMRHEITGVAVALVLAPPTVVGGNAPLSALGIFNIHAKMHGMTNAFKATALALSGLAGRSVLQLTESAAKHAAFAVDRTLRSSKKAKVIGRGVVSPKDYKYVESELGVGAVERWVDAQIEWVETSWVQKLGWATTKEKLELDAMGLRDRDPAALKLLEAHLEASKTKERRDRKMTVGDSAFSRKDQVLSGISTLADKVGMSVLDVIVNQMSLQFAKQELDVLQSQANIYGKIMSDLNPGQSYQAGKKSWSVSHDSVFAKRANLTGNRLAFSRNFFEKTGTPYEQILWKLYVRGNNENLVGDAVAVPLSDWSEETTNAVDAQKRLNSDVEDLQSRIRTLFIEEVNAPSAINRSSAARLSPFFRLTQPLMGYTADFFQKTLETVGGGDPDRERYKHLIEILGRLMFGAIAFTIVGLLGTQVREQVKRTVSKRSSGSTILTDEDFARDIRTMLDPNNGALASTRIESGVPLITALASAIPFVGDVFLIAANHISSAHSRGHILELGGKSVAIGMMHDLAMAGMSTVKNAYYGVATTVPAGDFLHRWLPYWDVASYHVFNQTDKQKYFGGYALKTEAVKLGITEPSKQIRRGLGLMSPDKAYEREIASAVSKRDEGSVMESVAGYVTYLQEHKELSLQDARRRVARQLRNLSPLNRASPKKLSRREKNQLLERVTGIRREPIDAALEDYVWAQKTIRRTNKIRITD